MKKLILTSLAVAAMLVSCEKESVVDSALTQAISNKAISYSPYAGASSTRGTAINSNTAFCGETGSYGSFKVSAYTSSAQYYDFDTVTYDGDNTGDKNWLGTSYYWPADEATLYFGAYYPAGATFSSDTPTYTYGSSSGHSLSIGYTVGAAVADHEDIMYAITSETPTNTDTTVDVSLHFKHTLTQVGFTATKSDPNLTVVVSSIKICNVVDTGTFTATAVTDDDSSLNEAGTEVVDADVTVTTGGWSNETAVANSANDDAAYIQHYAAAMADDDPIAVGSETTTLTSSTDVLMLLPQELTAWSPTGTGYTSVADTSVAYGTDSYLAIKCKITDGNNIEVIDGTIYVPFGTSNITYGDDDTSSAWRAGYKLTYNLVFGGGYNIPGDETEPAPGEVPDPSDVNPTLRLITYSVTVDEWKSVASSSVSL